MRRVVVFVLIAAVIAIAIFVYRSQRSDRLQVAPDAREEIEKAKRR